MIISFRGPYISSVAERVAAPMDRRTVAKLELRFAEIVRSNLGITDEKLGSLSPSSVYRLFLRALEEEPAWHPPEVLKQLYGATLSYYLEESQIDTYKQAFGHFDTADLIIILQRLYSILVLAYQCGVKQAPSVKPDLNILISSSWSHAQIYSLFERAGLAGMSWETEVVDTEACCLLEQRKFMAAVDRLRAKPAVSVLRAVSAHFSVDPIAMEFDYACLLIIHLEQDHGPAERVEECRLEKVCKLLYRHFNEGGLQLILQVAAAAGIQRKGFIVERFMARGAENIVMCGRSQQGQEVVVKISNPGKMEEIHAQIESVKRTCAALRSFREYFSTCLYVTGAFVGGGLCTVVEISKLIKGDSLSNIGNRSCTIDLIKIAIKLVEGSKVLLQELNAINLDQGNPSNYIVTPQGQVKLIDLGRVRSLADIPVQQRKKKETEYFHSLIQAAVKVLVGPVWITAPACTLAVVKEKLSSMSWASEQDRLLAERAAEIICLSAMGGQRNDLDQRMSDLAHALGQFVCDGDRGATVPQIH
jgi:hypothetical protein